MRFHCARSRLRGDHARAHAAPWQGKLDLIEGVTLHESMPEHAMAAELAA
jgi:hypothetical protein